MESLIIYSIIFFIILISLIILYISLNPLEIKDKNIEKFYADSDELPPFVPKVLQGLSPDTYIERNVEGSSTEKYILIKKNTVIEFPKDFPNCQILVVGGGGAGIRQLGGGGGGGAVVYITNATINSDTYNIIVGSGGQASYTKGNNSSFAGIIAEGGGAGGSFSSDTFTGTSGGSGGGAQCDGGDGNPYPLGGVKGTLSTLNGFSGIIYGNNGGTGLPRKGGLLGAGGGGGAGENGSDGNVNFNCEGGKGGNGIQINIIGTTLYWGGGGGGSSYFNGNNKGGNGGLGGGGGGSCGNGNGKAGIGGGSSLNNGANASLSTLNGGAGGANTGGGGGGGGWWNGTGWGEGGAGGSGIVIIRYRPIKQELPLVTARNPADINLSLNTELNNILTARKPFTLFSLINRDINLEINYYKQHALIQDAIGVEKYIVGYSSYINELTSPLRLFSYDNTIANNTGAQFGINRYDKTTGLFINSISKPMPIKYIINVNNKDNIIDNQFYGDWVSIIFPTPFILIQYGFVANMAFENKAPGDWVLFGRDRTVSDNNSPYYAIDRANTNSNRTCSDMSCDDGRKSWKDYANRESLLNVNLLDNKLKCNEYLFIFTRLAYSDLRNNKKEGHQLHFKEIRMRSRE